MIVPGGLTLGIQQILDQRTPGGERGTDGA